MLGTEIVKSVLGFYRRRVHLFYILIESKQKKNPKFIPDIWIQRKLLKENLFFLLFFTSLK